MRLHPEFAFSFLRAPASITTTSLADTLTITRFMLCDRDADAFSRSPTGEAFQAYVRAHFWDERHGRGGRHHVLLRAAQCHVCPADLRGSVSHED